jgi:hypothetical protein
MVGVNRLSSRPSLGLIILSSWYGGGAGFVGINCFALNSSDASAPSFVFRLRASFRPHGDGGEPPAQYVPALAACAWS